MNKEPYDAYRVVGCLFVIASAIVAVGFFLRAVKEMTQVLQR